MKKVFSGVLTVIMAASCQTSPKVVAELTEAYPSRPANSVVVYDMSDSVPKMSDKIGIGLQLDSFRMSMERPEEIDTSKYDFYGIERLDLQFGLRFYM